MTVASSFGCFGSSLAVLKLRQQPFTLQSRSGKFENVENSQTKTKAGKARLFEGQELSLVSLLNLGTSLVVQ